MNANPNYLSRRSKKADYRTFLDITSDVLNNKELGSVLQIVANEAFSYFLPTRSTIFTRHTDTQIVDIYYSFSPEQKHDKVGLYEEKLVARKAFQQNKMLSLLDPKDFSIFFNYDTRNVKISQLISIPLINFQSSNALLSLAFINDNFALEKDDLILLNTLRNFVILAHKISYLENKYCEWTTFTTDYKKQLDEILKTLENLSEVGVNLAEKHILEMLKRETPKKENLINPNESNISSKTTSDENNNNRGVKPLIKSVRVDFENDPCGITKNLSWSGAYIETPHPLDFAEEFLLKLYLDDGDDPIDIKSKVVWTNIYGTKNLSFQKGMGIKFLDLSHQDKNRIEQYIKNNKSEARGEIS